MSGGVSTLADRGVGTAGRSVSVSGVDLEIEMLDNIKAAWDSHAAECSQAPKAILFHPGNHALIGWDEVLGVPVLPDKSVEPKRFKLVCGTGHGGFCADGDVVWDEDGSAYVYVPSAEVS